MTDKTLREVVDAAVSALEHTYHSATAAALREAFSALASPDQSLAESKAAAVAGLDAAIDALAGQVASDGHCVRNECECVPEAKAGCVSWRVNKSASPEQAEPEPMAGGSLTQRIREAQAERVLPEPSVLGWITGDMCEPDTPIKGYTTKQVHTIVDDALAAQIIPTLATQPAAPVGHIEAWTWFDEKGEYRLARDEPSDGEAVFQITALVAAPTAPAPATDAGRERAIYTGHVCPTCGNPCGDGDYLPTPPLPQGEKAKPRGWLLQWPKIGGGRDWLWHAGPDEPTFVDFPRVPLYEGTPPPAAQPVALTPDQIMAGLPDWLVKPTRE